MRNTPNKNRQVVCIDNSPPANNQPCPLKIGETYTVVRQSRIGGKPAYWFDTSGHWLAKRFKPAPTEKRACGAPGAVSQS